jgi:hypothetical protein
MAERIRPRVVPAIVGTVALLVVLLGWLPALTKVEPRILSTPGAPPIGVDRTVALAKGAPVCVDQVVLEPDLRAARFRLSQTNSQSRPPIGVILRDAHGHLLSRGALPGGPGDLGDIDVPVRGPAHETFGEVCLTSAFPKAVDLSGTLDYRTRSRSTTRVGGSASVSSLTLTLLGPSSTPLSRAVQTVRHAATFKPITAWGVALLALLALLGVPAGVAATLRAALREDER